MAEYSRSTHYATDHAIIEGIIYTTEITIIITAEPSSMDRKVRPKHSAAAQDAADALARMGKTRIADALLKARRKGGSS